MHIARRLDGIKASASAEISLRVRELRAEGRDIIDLGIGQPDFDTPAPYYRGRAPGRLRWANPIPPYPGHSSLARGRQRQVRG